MLRRAKDQQLSDHWVFEAFPVVEGDSHLLENNRLIAVGVGHQKHFAKGPFADLAEVAVTLLERTLAVGKDCLGEGVCGDGDAVELAVGVPLEKGVVVGLEFRQPEGVVSASAAGRSGGGHGVIAAHTSLLGVLLLRS